MRRLAVLAALALCGCGRPSEPSPMVVPGGDVQRGADLTRQIGCPACHTIPGVHAQEGLVGPPLAHVARRTIIAGVLPNTPENMVRWIASPQAVVPGNAMPDMGLSPQQARDIAAYMGTLQ